MSTRCTDHKKAQLLTLRGVKLQLSPAEPTRMRTRRETWHIRTANILKGLLRPQALLQPPLTGMGPCRWRERNQVPGPFLVYPVSTFPASPNPALPNVSQNPFASGYYAAWMDMPLFCALNFYLYVEAQLAAHSLGLPLTELVTFCWTSHSALHILLLLLVYCLPPSKGLFPTPGREEGVAGLISFQSSRTQ